MAPKYNSMEKTPFANPILKLQLFKDKGEFER